MFRPYCLARKMDKKECSVKQSDFSIDHILNRAGELVKKPEIKCNCDSNLSQSINLTLPAFDWLQYTRYHPPKLPRPLRMGPVKRTPGRLPRVPFTPAQLDALEQSYTISTYLSSEEANKLADSLSLSSVRVKIWFQNRRARERRERRELELSDDNNVNFPSLLSRNIENNDKEIVDDC